jgi:tRNA 2-selenouridine synthase
VAIDAPRRARAEYLVRAYADLVADRERLDGIVASLRPLHPAEVIAEWRGMAAAGRFADLAEGLMERHYDPRYGKHRARMEVPCTEIAVARLEEADLPALADRIAAEVAGI